MASMTRDSGLDVVLSVLARRKWIGLSAFVASLSLGVPFALFLPNVYRGVATVSIENLDASGLVRVNVEEVETRLVQIQQELLDQSVARRPMAVDRRLADACAGRNVLYAHFIGWVPEK